MRRGFLPMLVCIGLPYLSGGRLPQFKLDQRIHWCAHHGGHDGLQR